MWSQDQAYSIMTHGSYPALNLRPVALAEALFQHDNSSVVLGLQLRFIEAQLRNQASANPSWLIKALFCKQFSLELKFILSHWQAWIIQDTVMLGADYYETDAEITSLLAEGRVPTGIGENTQIRSSLIKWWFLSLSLITLLCFLGLVMCCAGDASSTRMRGLGKILSYLIQR